MFVWSVFSTWALSWLSRSSWFVFRANREQNELLILSVKSCSKIIATNYTRFPRTVINETLVEVGHCQSIRNLQDNGITLSSEVKRLDSEACFCDLRKYHRRSSCLCEQNWTLVRCELHIWHFVEFHKLKAPVFQLSYTMSVNGFRVLPPLYL